MPSRKTSKSNFDSFYQARWRRFSNNRIRDLSLRDQAILGTFSTDDGNGDGDGRGYWENPNYQTRMSGAKMPSGSRHVATWREGICRCVKTWVVKNSFFRPVFEYVGVLKIKWPPWSRRIVKRCSCFQWLLLNHDFGFSKVNETEAMEIVLFRLKFAILCLVSSVCF